MGDNAAEIELSPQEKLGKLLKQSRDLREISLRGAADRAHISATYLSQLEQGKITTPSPRLLHNLADVYGESYALYMKTAGYVVPRDPQGDSSAERPVLDAALSSTTPLSDDERNALMEYLAWYRSRRGQPPEKS